MSYRSSHAGAGYAATYDETYRRGFYRQQWEQIERPLLENLFGTLASGGTRSILDFACGTGRIAGLAAGHFQEVVGVDVASGMVERARRKHANVRFLEHDLTRVPLERHFDAVTAFRFFLNAEATLREEALRAIRAHLARPDSVLIANVHVRSGSPLGAAYGVRNIMRRRRIANVLSERKLAGLLREHGFQVERIIRYGLLPRIGWWFPAWWAALMEPMERVSQRVPLLARLAQSFLVVARRGP